MDPITMYGIGAGVGGAFNWLSGRATNAANAREAKKNRDWEDTNYWRNLSSQDRMRQEDKDYATEMSNTAHQREVADLKAAGLNPALSAGGGGSSSAPVGGGSPPSSGSPVQAKFESARMGDIIQSAVTRAIEGGRYKMEKDLNDQVVANKKKEHDILVEQEKGQNIANEKAVEEIESVKKDNIHRSFNNVITAAEASNASQSAKAQAEDLKWESNKYYKGAKKIIQLADPVVNKIMQITGGKVMMDYLKNKDRKVQYRNRNTYDVEYR